MPSIGRLLIYPLMIKCGTDYVELCLRDPNALFRVVFFSSFFVEASLDFFERGNIHIAKAVSFTILGGG